MADFTFNMIYDPCVILPIYMGCSDDQLAEVCAMTVSKMKKDGDIPEEFDFIKVMKLEPWGHSFEVQGTTWAIVVLNERYAT